MWIRDLDAMLQRRMDTTTYTRNKYNINKDSSSHREVQGKIRVFSAFLLRQQRPWPVPELPPDQPHSTVHIIKGCPIEQEIRFSAHRALRSRGK